MQRHVIAVLLLAVLAVPACAAPIRPPSQPGPQVPPGVPRPDLPDIPDAALPPALLSVTPDAGSPYDVVVLKARNTSSDKTRVEAWFKIHTNYTVQGTVLSATKAQNIVTYEVRVPGHDYVTSRYDGQVYLKLKDTGKPTNSLVFHFDPCPAGIITGHSPQTGAVDRRMTFTGTRFKPTDAVFFVFQGQGTVSGIDKVYVSPTQFTVKMPAYQTIMKTAQVYVRSKCGSGWVQGAPYTFPIDAPPPSPKPK